MKLEDFHRGDLLISWLAANRQYLVLAVNISGYVSGSDGYYDGLLKLLDLHGGREEILPPSYFGDNWQVVREEA